MNTMELKTSENYPLNVKISGDNDPKIIYIRELIKQICPGRIIDKIVPHQEGFYGPDGYLGYDDNVLYYAKVFGINPTTELFDNTCFTSPKGDIEGNTDSVNNYANFDSTTMATYEMRFSHKATELPEHLFYAVYPSMATMGGQWVVTMITGYKITLYPIS